MIEGQKHRAFCTVRNAVHSDVPAIMAMGLQFFNAAGWPKVAEWDDASVETTLNALIDGKMAGGLVVAESLDRCVGMAGYLVYPFYCNLNVKIGQEVFWWIDPSHRFGTGAALKEQIERGATAQGATVFIMASVAGMRDAALARLYESDGYHAAENTFIKRLTK
jgi:hypothetical protein